MNVHRDQKHKVAFGCYVHFYISLLKNEKSLKNFKKKICHPKKKDLSNPYEMKPFFINTVEKLYVFNAYYEQNVTSNHNEYTPLIHSNSIP